MSLLAIVGGSGLYDLPGLTDTRWVSVETPWGAPSDQIFMGRLVQSDGAVAQLAFLPRHGRGHRIPPSEVNYRANIAALKQLGVTDVLSLSAVGGLRADLPPGTFVIVDQFIDRTFAREKSFFGTGLVAHVSLADPVCNRLGNHVEQVLRHQAGPQVPFVRGGCYLTIEGPQFSTRAESDLYRSWNCAVIGMTNMPEAKLAREAELPYATLAMVTDYDCWREHTADVQVTDVLAILKSNAEAARGLIQALVRTLPERREFSPIDTTLDLAVITAPDLWDEELKARLAVICPRRFS